MTDYEKIILEIKNENKRLQLLINDLIKSNESLTNTVNKLEQKLSYYENPHSPPSSNSLLSRKQKAEKRQKSNDATKRGGISGHKGATQKFAPQKSLITNHLSVPNVIVHTSRKLKLKKESWYQFQFRNHTR